MFTNFQNSFSVRLSNKFAINLKIPPCFDHVVHYLVKCLCSKNRHTQKESAAKCRARLSHSKNCFGICVWWNKQHFVPWQKNVDVSHIKKHMTHCTQLLQQRKRCHSKMPDMISSRWWRQSVSQNWYSEVWYLLIIRANESSFFIQQQLVTVPVLIHKLFYLSGEFCIFE